MELFGAVRQVSAAMHAAHGSQAFTQMRRTSAAAPRRLAEGYDKSPAEYREAVLAAREALGALESQLQSAVRWGYVSSADASNACRRTRETASKLNCLAMALENC